MSNNHPVNNDNHRLKKNFFWRLNQLFHGEPKNRNDLVELIRNLEQKDVIGFDIKEMLEGVINISNERVRNIMIPRSQIITLKQNQSLDECLNVIIKSSHSRFPVINEDKDHIEGLLIAKDLLSFMGTDAEAFTIDKILRPTVIVPESKRIDLLLKEFRSQCYRMAIVIDEFGGVSGLVTIEDIFKLIIGEIEDKSNAKEDINIRQLGNHTYSVCGITQIDNFNKVFSTRFNDEEVDTIAGLLMKAFGHLPTRGEVIIIDGYIFKITIADSRKIIQVQVEIPDKALIPNLIEE